MVVSAEDTKNALTDIGNRVTILEGNKKATEACLLDKLTERMNEIIGNDYCKSCTDPLLGEIAKESKKLGIAGVDGMLNNHEAVKEFAKKIFKVKETEPITGKVECFSCQETCGD